MPVIKCDDNIKKFTSIDKRGRLRSYVKFDCINCKNETVQRIDEYNRKGKLCKDCKIKQNSENQLLNKDLELVCSANLLSQLKRRYLKKGLTSNLNKYEVLSLIKDNCHYCGSEPLNKKIYKQKHFEYNFIYNGIDRVDSKKGYIKGNVVTCCKKCNLAKSDMEYNEFINHIKIIFNHIVCQ